MTPTRGAPLHVSFSGSGFLLPFHLGAAQALIHANRLHPTTTSHLCGTSGGGIVACALALGLPIPTLRAWTTDMTAACRASGTTWRLHAHLEHYLHAKLAPPLRQHFDARSGTGNGSGLHRLTLTTTRLWPPPAPTLCWKRQFDGPEEVLTTLLTSAFLPLYSAPAFTRRMYVVASDDATRDGVDGNDTRQRKNHSEWHADGGLLTLCPTPANHLPIHAFPPLPSPRTPAGTHAHAIYASTGDDLLNWSYTDYMYNALRPPPSHILDALFRMGEQEATTWLTLQHPLNK